MIMLTENTENMASISMHSRVKTSCFQYGRRYDSSRKYSFIFFS